jgi:ABC-type phosphate/phosphonate transport system substrate-binding protein
MSESFNNLWKNGKIKDHRGEGGGFTSPCALSVTNRKLAASFIYDQAIKTAKQGYESKIQELEAFKKEALEIIDKTHGIYENGAISYLSDNEKEYQSDLFEKIDEFLKKHEGEK